MKLPVSCSINIERLGSFSVTSVVSMADVSGAMVPSLASIGPAQGMVLDVSLTQGVPT